MFSWGPFFSGVHLSTICQASINATDDSHLCAVCMDEEHGFLCVPCNHLAVCAECEEGLVAASMACPMCQEPIDRERSIMGIVVS